MQVKPTLKKQKQFWIPSSLNLSLVEHRGKYKINFLRVTFEIIIWEFAVVLQLMWLIRGIGIHVPGIVCEELDRRIRAVVIHTCKALQPALVFLSCCLVSACFKAVFCDSDWMLQC